METVNTNESFIKAYDEFSDAIFRHCFFKLSNREQAKDAMQDIFMKTWEYVSKKGEIRNIKAFLYHVANNLIIDQYRKRKYDSSIEEMKETGFEIVSNDHKNIFNFSEVRNILEIIEKLEPIYKDVLIFRYVDDLSPKEIAEILNESENVISVRLNRGIKKVQEFFNK
ncbi:MAG: sigma-70 family RNA polymerase sigma factor [Candidatus Paceibacterota bacterium]